MSSMIGSNLKLSIFGQSHSEGIGVVIDGLPSGKQLNMDRIMAFMNRRRPGQGAHTTSRSETDSPEIISGLFEGKTSGAPLCTIFQNLDIRSSDYSEIRTHPRPGHADFSAWAKYKGNSDYRGGGHFSGRLTAPLCFAGAVCLQFLEETHIAVGAHIASIGEIADTPFDSVNITENQLIAPGTKPFPVIDDEKGEKMLSLISTVHSQQDSIGGIVECGILGIPAGIGNPMFDGIENRIAQVVFGIPAVKGIEFGAGFSAAKMLGSQNNDPFEVDNGQIKTSTNAHGGILGGISTGMPIIFRAAFKPTPSIAKPQQTVDLETQEPVEITTKGRHDPCIVPRAVPCIEAAAAFVIMDMSEGILWNN